MMRGKKAVDLAWTYVVLFIIGIAALIFFLVLYTKIGEGLRDAIKSFFEGMFGV